MKDIVSKEVLAKFPNYIRGWLSPKGLITTVKIKG